MSMSAPGGDGGERDADVSQLVCKENYAGYIALKEHVKRQKLIIRSDQGVAPYVKIARLNKLSKAVTAVCKCPFPITSKEVAKSIDGIGDSFSEIIYSAIYNKTYKMNDPVVNSSADTSSSGSSSSSSSTATIVAATAAATTASLPSNKRKRGNNSKNDDSNSNSDSLYAPLVGKAPWAILLSLLLLNKECGIDGSSFNKSDVIAKCFVLFSQFLDLRSNLLNDIDDSNSNRPLGDNDQDEDNDKIRKYFQHNFSATLRILKDKELVSISVDDSNNKVKNNQLFTLSETGLSVTNQLYSNMLVKSRSDNVFFFNRAVLNLPVSQDSNSIVSNKEKNRNTISGVTLAVTRPVPIQINDDDDNNTNNYGNDYNDYNDENDIADINQNEDSNNNSHEFLSLDDWYVGGDDERNTFRSSDNYSFSSSKSSFPMISESKSGGASGRNQQKSEIVQSTNNILSRLKSLTSISTTNSSSKSFPDTSNCVTIDLTDSPNPDSEALAMKLNEDSNSATSTTTRGRNTFNNDDSTYFISSSNSKSTTPSLSQSSVTAPLGSGGDSGRPGRKLDMHDSSSSQSRINSSNSINHSHTEKHVGPYSGFGFLDMKASSITTSSLKPMETFTESARLFKERLDKVGQNLFSESEIYDTSNNVTQTTSFFNDSINNSGNHKAIYVNPSVLSKTNSNSSNNTNMSSYMSSRQNSASAQSNVDLIDLTDDGEEDSGDGSDDLEVISIVHKSNKSIIHSQNSNISSRSSSNSSTKFSSSSNYKADTNTFHNSYSVHDNDGMGIIADPDPTNRICDANSSGSSRSNSRSISISNSRSDNNFSIEHISDGDKLHSSESLSLYSKVLRETLSSINANKKTVGPISTFITSSQPSNLTTNISKSAPPADKVLAHSQREIESINAGGGFGGVSGGGGAAKENKSKNSSSSSSMLSQASIGESLSRSNTLTSTSSSNSAINSELSSNALAVLMANRSYLTSSSNSKNSQGNSDKIPKASTSTKDDMQKLDVVVTNPNEYEVVLLVDNREKQKEFVSGTMNDTNGHQVNLKVCSLPLGDFLWIAVPKTIFADGNFLKDDKLTKHGAIGKSIIVLDYIIERKTMSDLSSSIMDDRYRNQQHRMKKKSNISNCMYFLEGLTMSGDSHSVVCNNGLRRAMLETQIGNGFKIVRTRSIEHTVNVLKNMNRLIIEEFYQASQYPKAIQSFTKFYYNTKPMSALYYPEATANQLFQNILYQVPHVSPNVINQLIQHFDTFNQFLKYFRSNDKKTVTTWLSGLRKIGTTEQKFGPVLADELWGLFGEIF